MQKNPLFKGLTRPPMIFGVPMTPLVMAMGGILLLAFYSQNIFLTAFAIPVFFIMKAMTKRDDFIFRLMFLKMRFFSIPLLRITIRLKHIAQILIDKCQKTQIFQKYQFLD